MRQFFGRAVRVPSSTGWRCLVLGCLAALVATAAMLPASAQADFGFDGKVSMNDTDGLPARQAGSHPDLVVQAMFPEKVGPNGFKVPDGSLRDLKVATPPGLVGNPTVVSSCKWTELLNLGSPYCPISSQVGFAEVIGQPEGSFETGAGVGIREAVYSMEHGPDVPAVFAFQYANNVVSIRPNVRAGDYGITTSSTASSEGVPIYGVRITLWGVPADPSHDWQRIGLSLPGNHQSWVMGAPSPEPAKPFLSVPTSCPGTPWTTEISANSWQNPGIVTTQLLSRDGNGDPFIGVGCDKLAFAPSMDVQPTSRQAAEPTGLNVKLVVPQSESPEASATADVRRVAVTFPEGMTVSPSSAAGQGACSEAQIGIGSNTAPTCPGSSVIGTVKIKTPLLEEELDGDVILAKQNENPFHSLLALYIAVKGPGFYLKLPGKVEADPVTGRLTATFSETPQLPFEEMRLSLDSGPQAPLQAPGACGTYQTQVAITSWASAAPVSFQVPMTIDQGCGTGGFNPALKAGVVDPGAGRFSAFMLRITRQSGEQNISRIAATLPEGELAKLAGVPLCPDAAALSGSCPAASQIGKTVIGAGPGPNPLYVPEAGKAPTAVYLAGPYNSAPYSLVVKVPAQAGPFDLGTVAVRSAIQIDPETTQASVVSDPLPQILQGIPISYRDVRVEVDRPDFTLNPTSCAPMAVQTTLTSAGGKTAAPAAPFQVGNCAGLAFKPALSLRLKGGTRRTAYPALTATLKPRAGDANIARAAVALPHSEFLAQEHIRTICTRVQFAAGQCPAGSVYGKATAWSPLLDRPISGPVYLRSSSNRLPDLVADLNGQIRVTLVGRIDSVKGGIRTSFEAVPDAPVSKFVLKMRGGKKSLLVNSRNLCKSVNRATVRFTGQNGREYHAHPAVGAKCPKKKHNAHHRHHRGKGAPARGHRSDQR